MGRRATTDLVACAALVLGAVCCGGRASPAALVGASTAPLAAPLDFTFDSLDERPVSSESTRGKLTVIAFVTTGSLAALAQVNFLSAMAKNDRELVNYALVVLDGPENRELVEMYANSLALTFPVALGDAKALAGSGPFGAVAVVPVTVLLDREGHVVWSARGRVAKSDEIRRAMHGL